MRPSAMRAAVLALAATMVGCGGGAAADPDRAAGTLRAALDAWKDGRPPEELSGQSPPIHVNEPRWRGGARLIRYDISGDATPEGFDLQFPVELWIQGARGKPTRERARYIVSTGAEPTVVRAAF